VWCNAALSAPHIADCRILVLVDVLFFANHQIVLRFQRLTLLRHQPHGIVVNPGDVSMMHKQSVTRVAKEIDMMLGSIQGVHERFGGICTKSVSLESGASPSLISFSTGIVASSSSDGISLVCGVGIGSSV